ncbi:GNAT family N-acetyltransferase [Salinarimonas soli]|uniref:GNAT family N-acetyltransferase n=1 Tax=Salinarimonas soli TaxID=1638099 RepID=A0A5B2VQQ6_9HYPH|nr:GNAT family N-acetyltransferase [Salinarimonas soli]KAA2241104.1 GNAT family N-acetyltransferase [Salinarimonas soli]
MSDLTADVIRTADGLTALEAEWWKLWRRCESATPFQSPAWLLPWWQVFAPGELRAIAVRDAGRLVALAPFYREDGAHGRRLLPLGIGLSDYGDILRDPLRGDAALAIVHAAAQIEGWDSLSLEDLAPGAAALTLRAGPGMSDATERQCACPVLDLTAAPVPAGKRRKLRMAQNRAARRAGFSIESVEADGIDAFLDALFDLHGARWATRGEGGVLAEDPVRRFHRAAAPALHRAGLARFALMRLEGRVVGAYYGLADARRAYAYLGGFDPAFAFESPGTLLVGHAIDSAAQAGAGEFHFLRGQEPYKYEWGAVDRWSMRRVLTRQGAHV